MSRKKKEEQEIESLTEHEMSMEEARNKLDEILDKQPSAEAIEIVTNMAMLGPVMTVDEARVKFLGKEKHKDSSIGESYLTLSTLDYALKG